MTGEAQLAWKLAMFVAGAALLVLGIVLEQRVLVLASIVTLGIGIVLRLVYRQPPPPRHPSWDQPEE